MVLRNTDNARGPLERIADNKRKVEDLARAHNRGSTAMRDSAGNILEMNGEAPYPLLTPQNIDSAVAFTPDGTVKITSTDTTQDRDMTVRDITSSGSVVADGTIRATGDVTANNLRTDGQTTCNNLGANSGNFGTLVSGFTQVGNLKSAQINTVGDIYTPGYHINTDPNGAMYSKTYYGGEFRGVYVNTSDARLKQAFCALNEADVDALARVPVWEWSYRADAHNLDEARRHIGPVAQDMPDIAVTRDEDIRFDENGDPYEGPSHGRLGIDQGTYMGLLLALVQRQGREIKQLAAEIDELKKSA